MKILFFTVGGIPTAAEQRMIDALNNLTGKDYSVEVRNSDESALYGANLEDCDFVAGNVPTEYLDIPSFGIYDNGTHAVIIEVYPPTVSVVGTATKQLEVLKSTGETKDNVVHVVTTSSNMAYVSSNSGIATVHSTNGLVTGVAAGSCRVTATLGGSLAVAECSITVSAS